MSRRIGFKPKGMPSLSEYERPLFREIGLLSVVPASSLVKKEHAPLRKLAGLWVQAHDLRQSRTWSVET